MRLVIHAPNVHQGGGKTLLLSLFSAEIPGDTIAILDARLGRDAVPENVDVLWTLPTVFGRIFAEWRLKRIVSVSDTVLCFGNLPPLFKVSGHVTLFLQNKYLFGSRDLTQFSRRIRARLMLERLWLSFRLCGSERYRVFVQTDSMARELKQSIGVDALVTPFLEYPKTSALPIGSDQHVPPHIDFIYVASGEPHKNHRRLIEAWCLLADQDVYPSLSLTLDPGTHSSLVNWIDSVSRKHKLRIVNQGNLPSEEISRLYRSAGALIFPSTLESYGLPLLEASAAGLPVIASELDYVRDVVIPAETFDPESPVSIARAVQRYLGSPNIPQLPITPDEFLKVVCAP